MHRCTRQFVQVRLVWSDTIFRFWAYSWIRQYPVKNSVSLWLSHSPIFISCTSAHLGLTWISVWPCQTLHTSSGGITPASSLTLNLYFETSLQLIALSTAVLSGRLTVSTCQLPTLARQRRYTHVAMSIIVNVRTEGMIPIAALGRQLTSTIRKTLTAWEELLWSLKHTIYTVIYTTSSSSLQGLHLTPVPATHVEHTSSVVCGKLPVMFHNPFNYFPGGWRWWLRHRNVQNRERWPLAHKSLRQCPQLVA